MDYSPPGPTVHGIIQAGILEWIVIHFSRGSSRPKDRTCVSCVGRWILYHRVSKTTLQIVCQVEVKEPEEPASLDGLVQPKKGKMWEGKTKLNSLVTQ